MLGLIAGAVGSGRMITRWGRYRPFPIAGMTTMTVGVLLLSSLDTDTSRLTQSIYMSVVGLGIGLVMQVLVLAVQNAADTGDLGIATSATSFFRSMGGAFGVAIFGSIFNSRLGAYLSDTVPGGRIDTGVLRAGPEALRSLPADVRVEVVDAFARALHVTFLWAVPVAAVGIVLAVALPELPLRESAHVGLSDLGETAVAETAPIPGTGADATAGTD